MITSLRPVARHLVALASSELLAEPGRTSPPSEEELAAAVRVSLHGYAAPARPHSA